MSIKLKGVEIEAFRGYEHLVYFNFLTETSRIADIIVIYAPNGFGKTSFFDAVEWGLKDKINRLQTKTLYEAAETARDIILQNRNSDRPGKVKYIDERGEFLAKTTVRTVKWDYVPGRVDASSNSVLKDYISNKDIKQTLVEILPQNAVDEFVFSTSPEDRYNALTSFWDGYEETKYYQGIAELFECNQEEIERQRKIIAQKEIEIQELSASEAIIAIYAGLIQSLNQITSFKDKLEEFSPDITKDQFEAFKAEYIKLKAFYTSKLESDQKSVERVKILEQGLNNHLQSIEQQKNLKAVLLDWQTIIAKFEQKTKENRSIEQLKEFANSQRKRLSSFLELSKNRDAFAAIWKDIIKNEKDKSRLIEENSKLAAYLQEKRFENLTLKQQFLAKEVEIKEQNDFLVSIENQKVLFRNYSNQHQFAQKRLEQSEQILQERQHVLSQVYNEINSLKALLNLSADEIVNHSNGLHVISNDLFHMIVEDVKNLLFEQRRLRTLLKEQEKIFFKSGTLSENLKKVVEFGKSYIIETKTSACPLCNVKQKDFQTLLSLIEEQHEDALGIESLQKSIENITANILENDYLAHQKVEAIRSIINNELRSLNILEKKVQKKVIQTTMFVTYYNNLVQLKKSELERLIAPEDIDNFNEQIIDFKIQNAKESLSVLTEQIEVIRGALLRTNVDIEEAEKIKMTTQGNISFIDASLASQNNSQILKESLQKLSILSLDVGKYIEEGVSSLEETEQRKLSEVEEELLNAESKAKLLEEETSAFSEEDARKSRQEIETQLNALQSRVLEYESKLRLFITYESDSDILSRITAVRFELDKTEAETRIVVDKLTQLLDHIELFERNVRLRNIRSELSILIARLEKLLQINSRLNTLKQSIRTYIDNKVNKVFNQKIINDIYQKIDPHPELKEIKLELEFDAIKPKLNIKAQNLEGTEKIDPVLYLSSAQINVLSLSIFLAKALQNKIAPISTIFMDDPIQYFDSINTLSFIDLLRIMISDSSIKRQVVFSTHDENFYRLLKKKFDPEFYNSKFIEFESYGVLR